jgi:hypothetical protein
MQPAHLQENAKTATTPMEKLSVILPGVNIQLTKTHIGTFAPYVTKSLIMRNIDQVEKRPKLRLKSAPYANT